MKAYLLQYTYKYYAEHWTGYALIYAPENVTHTELVGRLMEAKDERWIHEIVRDSVENLTF